MPNGGLVDSYVTDEAFHTIGIEDREGARMVTCYLIDKGHREIAFVSGSIREHGVNSKRYQGYCDAMQEAGLPVQEDALYLGTVSQEYGLEADREYLRRGRKQTAALATADVLAVGLVKGCLEQGLRLPQDLSVVGFDDVSLAQMCYPSLTTVHQDIIQKGREAVQCILNAIEKPGCPRQECILPLSVVERDSVCERSNAGCSSIFRRGWSPLRIAALPVIFCIRWQPRACGWIAGWISRTACPACIYG